MWSDEFRTLRFGEGALWGKFSRLLRCRGTNVEPSYHTLSEINRTNEMIYILAGIGTGISGTCDPTGPSSSIIESFSPSSSMTYSGDVINIHVYIGLMVVYYLPVSNFDVLKPPVP